MNRMRGTRTDALQPNSFELLESNTGERTSLSHANRSSMANDPTVGGAAAQSFPWAPKVMARPILPAQVGLGNWRE